MCVCVHVLEMCFVVSLADASTQSLVLDYKFRNLILHSNFNSLTYVRARAHTHIYMNDSSRHVHTLCHDMPLVKLEDFNPGLLSDLSLFSTIFNIYSENSNSK